MDDALCLLTPYLDDIFLVSLLSLLVPRKLNPVIQTDSALFIAALTLLISIGIQLAALEVSSLAAFPGDPLISPEPAL